MKRLTTWMVSVALLAVAQGATAAIVWEFGTEFSGSGGTLSGTVLVTVDDGGSAGTVDVTIDTNGLDGNLSEYISGLYLNLNPTLDPTSLGLVGDGAGVEWASATFGVDCCKADGDGFFDIQVNYNNTEFTAGMSDTFTFSLAGLVEDDFDFMSAPATGGGSGPFVAALRARSLGADGQNSGWFYPEEGGEPPGEVPVPGTLLLLGAPLVGITMWRRGK